MDAETGAGAVDNRQGNLKLWLGMLWVMGAAQPPWALPGALLLSVVAQGLWRREPVFGRLGPGDRPGRPLHPPLRARPPRGREG